MKKILRPFDITKPWEAFEGIIASWTRILVPFISKKQHSTTTLELFGSGFITWHGRVPYLVTARHVIDGVQDRGDCAVIINEKTILLERAVFATDEEFDVAVSGLLTWNRLLESGLNKARGAPLLHTYKREERYGVAVLGYPSSKNKFSAVRRSLVPNAYGVQFTELLSEGTYADASKLLTFRYDQTAFSFESNPPKINGPHLRGMSGGPVVEVVYNRDPCGDLNFSVNTIGVFTEWSRSIAKVAPHNAIERCIKKFEDIISRKYEK